MTSVLFHMIHSFFGGQHPVDSLIMMVVDGLFGPFDLYIDVEKLGVVLAVGALGLKHQLWSFCFDYEFLI